MCGRFALQSSEIEMVSHFHLRSGFSMRERFNIAPTQTIPIVCEWEKQIDFCRWGFIPSWAKSEENKIPTGYMNARQETLKEKPTFKTALAKQRCLIPATGYFEWRSFAGKKQPYFVYLKNQPLFAFAGLWSSWRSSTGLDITTCAIITTQAQGELQKLHDRMPVIFTPEKYPLWLSKENKLEVLENLLINPLPNCFGLHPVSGRMSSPRFEGIECIQAL